MYCIGCSFFSAFLFYTVEFFSVILHSTTLCFVLLCFNLLPSVLLYSIIFYSIWDHNNVIVFINDKSFNYFYNDLNSQLALKISENNKILICWSDFFKLLLLLDQHLKTQRYLQQNITGKKTSPRIWKAETSICLEFLLEKWLQRFNNQLINVLFQLLLFSTLF